MTSKSTPQKNFLPFPHAPLLLVLLLAFTLRFAALTNAPPGLTHDEANHGREAISLLDGNLTFYFPLNYGSEPLYSYMVAGSMGALGETLFALRFVGAIFGVLTLAWQYKWIERWFGDKNLALWTAGLTAVSYWAIVTSRMALRATLLPFFTLGAAYFFWRIAYKSDHNRAVAGVPPRHHAWSIIGFGFFVAMTLHIYLAARVVWLIFPAFVIYTLLIDRPLFKRLWRPTLLGLLLAAVLVTPMFLYLRNNPDAETRLQMFGGTVNATLAGNLLPILDNSRRALLAFIMHPYGDQFLAYNIPGKPVFGTITAALFIVGLLTCLWFWRRPRYAFILLWFGAGIAPSLITGPTANTTRNIGALPVIYLLPVIGFMTILKLIQRRQKLPAAVPHLAAVVWLTLVATLTVRDYFFRWATDPDVRAAYQTTIIAALEYVEEELPDGRPTILSSVYPGSAHDTSISMVTLEEKELPLRWVDARHSLIFTSPEPGNLLVPSSTPLHPHFTRWVTPEETVSIRPNDLDPSFTAYTLIPPANELNAVPLANFNDALLLLSAEWLAEAVPPGGVGELMTIWRVTNPEKIGPRVPPAYTTETVLFTQVLSPDNTILTQADKLDAPSWSWQAGDIIVQIHQLSVPPETAAGDYRTIVGVYEQRSGHRLTTSEGQTFTVAPPLTVRP